MSESYWKDDGYRPDEHGWWKATLDGRSDFGYPSGYYYADTVRAIATTFAKFFSDLCVIRYDEKGFSRKIIQVPIKFGPRSKAYDQRKEEESGKTYTIPMPNLYYKITSFQYDSNRASSTDATRTFYESYLVKNGLEESRAELLWEDTQPVPYNIGFELSAKATKMNDLLQIIDQILGRFNPDAFLFIKEFWFMNIRRDVKMKLDSVSFDYPDELGEQDVRELEAKFTFTVESQVYTKIVDGAIIDEIVMKLNPSIATHKTENVDLTVSGDPMNREFYLSDDGSNWLIKNGIVTRDRDSETSGVGIYVPAPGKEEAFRKWNSPQKYDPFGYPVANKENYWTFTSAYTVDTADPYMSIIGTSGNYTPDVETYDQDEHYWKGSMSYRHDFETLNENDIADSGTIEYLNSGNEKILAPWVTKHDIEIHR